MSRKSFRTEKSEKVNKILVISCGEIFIMEYLIVICKWGSLVIHNEYDL